MDDVTIGIATCGDERWRALARERAVPSALAEAAGAGVRVLHVHSSSGTLAQARNRVLSETRSRWLIHLDADDQIEPGYVATMLAAEGDLRVPAVRWVPDLRVGDVPAEACEARVLQTPGHEGRHPACTGDCLRRDGNWIPIGAMVRANLIREVGGWREWPLYEDYDLWLRCVRAGARVEAVPGAVYRAYVRAGSRNRAVSPAVARMVHSKIIKGEGFAWDNGR